MQTVGYYMGKRCAVLSVVPVACEQTFMDGFADEVTGNVESSIGHVYRVGRHLVRTDEQGFKHAYLYASEEDAKAAFEMADRKYSDWLDN